MLKVTQNNDLIIGIDVSKDKLDITVLPGSEHIVIKNNQKAICKFISSLLERHKKEEVRLCVMESTGGYEKEVAKCLEERGLPIHIAHPNQVFHFAKSRRSFAKTDKIDSKILAYFGTAMDLRLTILPSKDSEALKDLATRKMQLTEFLIAEKCRLKDHLSEPARHSISRLLKQLEKEIELIEKMIKELINSSDQKKKQAELLKTLKGIGEQTAHLLVATLPELGQLSRSEIASLTGVAPRNHDSGIKQGHRSIKGGRFYVRKALYMPALCALRHNQPLKEYYQRLLAKGKKPKVAIVAVIRKMVITLNAMVKNNEGWNPAFNGY